MAGAGYDISASVASSATAANSSPFSSTGGSKTVFSWQAAAALGLSIIAAAIIFMSGFKRK